MGIKLEDLQDSLSLDVGVDCHDFVRCLTSGEVAERLGVRHLRIAGNCMASAWWVFGGMLGTVNVARTQVRR